MQKEELVKTLIDSGWEALAFRKPKSETVIELNEGSVYISGFHPRAGKVEITCPYNDVMKGPGECLYFRLYENMMVSVELKEGGNSRRNEESGNEEEYL